MTNWDSLSSHQKLSLGVFIVIGACAVVLWPFLMSRQINFPFQRTGDISLKSADQLEQERTDKLKKMDTDHDGLSDYDELYIYHTSPYLADSDSDGIPDGVEVAQDTDPNCPQGKVCRQVIATQTPGATTDTNSAAPVTTDTNAGATAAAPTPPTDAQISAVISETFGDPATLTPDAVKATIEKMSAADLRAFLGKLGIPADALQKADDATLRKLITDTMSQIVVQAGGSTGAATGAGAVANNVNGSGDINADTNSGTAPAADNTNAATPVAP